MPIGAVEAQNSAPLKKSYKSLFRGPRVYRGGSRKANMAQLILTHRSQFHRAIRTRSLFPLTLRVGRFFLLFSMTFVIGLLSFVYLIKFTEIHTKGYQLRKLEIERDQLMTARAAQSTDIARMKSLNEIRQSEITSRMIPARNPVFIKTDGNVAQLPQWKP